MDMNDRQFRQMSEKEYNEYPGIRRSALWKMAESPEKYKYAMDNPEPPTPSLIFGTAAHKMLLEPEEFLDEFIPIPRIDRRTKEGREQWERFQSDVGSRTPVSQDDLEAITSMANKVRLIPYAADLLEGDHEHSMFWTDKDTGLECKVRADIIRIRSDGSVTVADYKTAASARTDVFNHDMFKYGYHLQAYMYTEAVKQTMGLTERPDFVFIVQEKKPPYSVNLVKVSEEVMTAGMDSFRELMGTLKECIESGFWWGYNGVFGEPNETYLPGWMNLSEDEE